MQRRDSCAFFTDRASAFRLGAMSEGIVSVTLPEAERRELERMARQLGRSPGETGSLLIQEGVRRHQFTDLDFRQTPTGRHAYIAGTRLAVWQIMQIGSR